MDTPDLSRTVEASVPIRSLEFGAYLGQVQMDVLPHIRTLQVDGQLGWFSFSIRPASQLAEGDADDNAPVIQLHLEPASGLDIAEFISLLPAQFEKPVLRPLSEAVGVDASVLRDGDWAHAWHMAGESSEWVLSLLEDHQAIPTSQQVVRFLHFITDAAGLGGSCMFVPGGVLPF